MDGDGYLKPVQEAPEPASEPLLAPVSLEGLRSIQAVLEELIVGDPKTHDRLVDILSLKAITDGVKDFDLGHSAAAQAINQVTEPLGFTTTRDSVRRWRSAN